MTDRMQAPSFIHFRLRELPAAIDRYTVLLSTQMPIDDGTASGMALLRILSKHLQLPHHTDLKKSRDTNGRCSAVNSTITQR